MPRITVENGQTTLSCQIDNNQDPSAPTLVFANSLGTTLHLWDLILPHLPKDLRIIRYDMRGHGQSDVPPPPYKMGALVNDAAAVCDAFDAKDAMIVGLSVGGMVAQGLAVKRPEFCRALVLSNTAAKIGHEKLWNERIATVQTKGMDALADDILQRWFGRDFLNSSDLPKWRAMLVATPPDGYAGTCAAISGTDFYRPTADLRLPTLGIAGSEDGATPPDLVRETIDLIPGSQFKLMRRAGHLPCVEQPEVYAAHLNAFIEATGHLKG